MADIANVTDELPVYTEVAMPRSGVVAGGTGEVAFIDGALPDVDILAADIRPGVQAIVVDGPDGFGQIARALADVGGLAAVHIVSHGMVGQITFGDATLDERSAAVHHRDLAMIGRSLAPGGDLLLYGCGAGAGEAGRQFLRTVARLAGVAVAGASAKVGRSPAGDNWTLDVHVGAVAAASVIPAAPRARYAHALQPQPTVSKIKLTDGYPAVNNYGTDAFTVTFTQKVSGISAADFFVTGSAKGSAYIATSDSQKPTSNDGGTTWIVQVTGITGNGTIGLGLNSTLSGTPSPNETYTVDLTAPDLTVSAPGVTNQTSVMISGKASDTNGIAGVRVFKGQMDLGAATLNQDGTYSLTVSNLTEGSNTFNVQATDKAGNNINTSVSVAVDRTAPIISSVTLDKASYKLGEIVTATIQLSGSSDNNGAYTLGSGSMLDGQTLTEGSYDSSSNTLTASFTATSGVAQVTSGTVADSIVVKDAIGNASTAHTAGTAGTATIDTVAPAFSSAAVTGNSLVLTYAETGSGLNSADVPVAQEFTVKDGANTDAVTGVVYDATNKTVTLTLASAAAYGDDAVTVAYAPSGTASQNIQDSAGNLAAGFSNRAVTNSTAAPTLSVSDATVSEGAGTETFTVTLTGATALPISVDYATADDTAHATAGGPGRPDYTATSGTLTFDASSSGTQTRTVTVPITNDSVYEASERFFLNLSNPTNGAILSDAQGIGTITDDDAAPTVTVTGLTTATDSGTAGDNRTDIAAPVISGQTTGIPAGSAVTLYLDGSTTALGTATTDASGKWTYTFGALSTASHSVIAKVSYPASPGTATSSAYAFDIDPVPSAPTLALTQDSGTAADGITGDPRITYSAALQGGQRLYKTDTGSYSTTAPAFATNGSADGQHTVSVKNQDSHGNLSQATSLTFTLDTTAPAIAGVTLDKTIYKLGDTVTATIRLTGKSDGNGAYTLGSGSTIDGVALTEGTYDSQTNTLTASFKVDANTKEVTAGDLAASIQVADTAGNESAASTTPLGAETIDRTAPAFSAASVSGGTLTLTYAETGSGLAATVPATGDYSVLVGGAADAVSGVAVDAAAGTVTLTLASAVAASDQVSVTYTPGQTGLQDLAGNAAAALTSQTVTNLTPVPPPAGGGAPAASPTTPATGPSTPATPTPTITGTPTNNSPATLTPPSLSFDPMVRVSSSTTVTLSGTASDPSGIAGVEIFEGTKDLGAATLNGDGTWSFLLNEGAGTHSDLSAGATANDGATSTAASHYNLVTGLSGMGYAVEQDRFDPATGLVSGQTFFKRKGIVFQETTFGYDESGTSRVTQGGSYFNRHPFYAYIDDFAPDGTQTEEDVFYKDGHQTVQGLVQGATLNAIFDDTFFTQPGGGNTFVFTPGFGQDTITDLVLRGPHHDTLSLPDTAQGRLGAILHNATTDANGDAVLHLNRNDSITLQGVTVADIQQHRRDFTFHA